MKLLLGGGGTVAHLLKSIVPGPDQPGRHYQVLILEHLPNVALYTYF